MIPQTVDRERFGTGVDIEKFLNELEQLQIPCPWGDLVKTKAKSANINSKLPNIPLALILGCGYDIDETSYYAIANTQGFTKLVASDILNPNLVPNHIVLDLENPEEAHLFGYKVHAIISRGVFTYDGSGVNFQDRKIEIRTAKSLSDLLIPGGIIANCNFGQFRFEQILEENHGFKNVRSSLYHGVILQKPF